MQLTPEEQLAFQLLQQGAPEVLKQLAKNDVVNVNDIIAWYRKFSMKLDWIQARKANDFIEATSS